MRSFNSFAIKAESSLSLQNVGERTGKKVARHCFSEILQYKDTLFY